MQRLNRDSYALHRDLFSRDADLGEFFEQTSKQTSALQSLLKPGLQRCDPKLGRVLCKALRSNNEIQPHFIPSFLHFSISAIDSDVLRFLISGRFAVAIHPMNCS